MNIPGDQVQFLYEIAPDTPKKEGTECKNL